MLAAVPTGACVANSSVVEATSSSRNRELVGCAQAALGADQ